MKKRPAIKKDGYDEESIVSILAWKTDDFEITEQSKGLLARE